jgi:hypothetical protein
MTTQLRKGHGATIVRHCPVRGNLETVAKSFKVSDVETLTIGSWHPADQHKVMQRVQVHFVEPRKRNWSCFTFDEGDLVYITVEHNGKVYYDSRQDVPCDMSQYALVEEAIRTGSSIGLTRRR